jgi:hypothetical protein
VVRGRKYCRCFCAGRRRSSGAGKIETRARPCGAPREAISIPQEWSCCVNHCGGYVELSIEGNKRNRVVVEEK